MARSASSVAMHTCRLMVSGRGVNIASEADYADGKYGGNLMVVQFMRDFVEKEVLYYAYLNNLRAGPQTRYSDSSQPALPIEHTHEHIIGSFLTQIQVTRNKTNGL